MCNNNAVQPIFIRDTTMLSSSVSWKLPLLCFLLYLPFVDAVDHVVASYFLGDHSKFHAPAWSWAVYKYGLIPGQLLCAASALIFVASFFAHRLSSLQRPALYLCLTLAIGSGLFGHALFKQFWERPRPKQVALYGGTYPFCSLTTPYRGPADRHLRSLPSGHATMGFYFFALYFLGRRLGRRWLAWTGLCMAIVLGGLLSWVRLAQGGHFFSDIIVSMLLMWLSAYWVDRVYAHISKRCQSQE